MKASYTYNDIGPVLWNNNGSRRRIYTTTEQLLELLIIPGKTIKCPPKKLNKFLDIYIYIFQNPKTEQ